MPNREKSQVIFRLFQEGTALQLWRYGKNRAKSALDCGARGENSPGREVTAALEREADSLREADQNILERANDHDA